MSHPCLRCGKSLYAKGAECNCRFKSEDATGEQVCDCCCTKAMHKDGVGKCRGCGICSKYTVFGEAP